MQELHAALLALQDIDAEIARAEARLEEFTPKLTALEAPVLNIERELQATQAKLLELRAEQERLQKNAQQKQERLAAYQEKLTKARTSRDEAAVRAEVELVRKALDADHADFKQTSEQATRTDLKLDDVQRQLDKARAEIEAEQFALMEQREAAETELAQVRDKRENEAIRLDAQSRRLYERVRAGKTKRAVAPLTEEGACGNCFNILPIQEQVEVRRGAMLRRCEGCGVILYAA